MRSVALGSGAYFLLSASAVRARCLERQVRPSPLATKRGSHVVPVSPVIGTRFRRACGLDLAVAAVDAIALIFWLRSRFEPGPIRFISPWPRRVFEPAYWAALTRKAAVVACSGPSAPLHG